MNKHPHNTNHGYLRRNVQHQPSTRRVERYVIVAQKLVQSLRELNSGSKLECKQDSGPESELNCKESLVAVPLLSTLLTSAPRDAGSALVVSWDSTRIFWRLLMGKMEMLLLHHGMHTTLMRLAKIPRKVACPVVV